MPDREFEMKDVAEGGDVAPDPLPTQSEIVLFLTGLRDALVGVGHEVNGVIVDGKRAEILLADGVVIGLDVRVDTPFERQVLP